jgi:hypothetical protein
MNSEICFALSVSETSRPPEWPILKDLQDKPGHLSFVIHGSILPILLLAGKIDFLIVIAPVVLRFFTEYQWGWKVTFTVREDPVNL